MNSAMKILAATARAATVLALAASAASADPLTCNLNAYKAAAGLTASVADNVLSVTWDGDKGQEVRLRFALDAGTPTIRDLAIRRKGSPWATLCGGSCWPRSVSRTPSSRNPLTI